MNRKLDPQTETLLMANGSSGRWDVAVDESLSGEEWFLDLESPGIYLVFQLQDPTVIPRALDFLRTGPGTHQTDQRDQEHEGAIQLGQFGSSAVCLIWDNEDFPRCFLVIGSKAHPTLRISLEAEDIRMLSEALDQVVKELLQAGIPAP